MSNSLPSRGPRTDAIANTALAIAWYFPDTEDGAARNN